MNIEMGVNDKPAARVVRWGEFRVYKAYEGDAACVLFSELQGMHHAVVNSKTPYLGAAYRSNTFSLGVELSALITSILYVSIYSECCVALYPILWRKHSRVDMHFSTIFMCASSTKQFSPSSILACGQCWMNPRSSETIQSAECRVPRSRTRNLR